jgi:hypothetical protein
MVHVLEPLVVLAETAFSLLSSHASFSGNFRATIMDGDRGRRGGTGGGAPFKYSIASRGAY